MEDSEIERINALAPFDHGVWEGTSSTGEKITVGEQALFRSRSVWLVEKIVNYLLSEFSLETLRTLSLLEIGSYDGWVLTQICKRIEFSEALGIEARKKNIIKGEVGRRLSGTETQATFMVGRADQVDELLPDRDFDIVICLGMLHHVSSTYDTIASISSKSIDVVIIDSMVIPEIEDDLPRIEPFVNTRDIVYHGEKNTWSVAAFKFESPYGDGSRANFGIVNIPTVRLIGMSLRSCGFGEMNALGDESEFFDDSGQQLRGVRESISASRREIASGEVDKRWKEKVENSENIFCHTVLPDVLILGLAKLYPEFENLDIYSDVSSASSVDYDESLEATIKSIMSAGVDEATINHLSANVKGVGDTHFQIMAVIFRSPYEKIVLEVSKFLLEKNQPDLATKYLQLIVRKPGCDWWSFYRSCYVLRKSFQKLGNEKQSEHYQELLTLSNENFPF